MAYGMVVCVLEAKYDMLELNDEHQLTTDRRAMYRVNVDEAIYYSDRRLDGQHPVNKQAQKVLAPTVHIRRRLKLATRYMMSAHMCPLAVIPTECDVGAEDLNGVDWADYPETRKSVSDCILLGCGVMVKRRRGPYPRQRV